MILVFDVRYGKLDSLPHLMALAHKPPSGLPGSVAIHLPAFKRKRIEQWCEDVAHYLRTGSLCRSVIGHVIEDNRAGQPAQSQPVPGVRSAPPGNSRTASVGTMTDAGNNKFDVGFKVTKIECTAPPTGRGTPMPDASGPLPVVKFSYSHYNDQRKKMDRLVQGLPSVLSTPAPASTPGADRLTHNGAVVYVNGEEPIRGAGFGSAGSGRERERVGKTSARASPVPASRSSSGEPRLRNSVPAPSGNQARGFRSHSPGPNHTTQSHNLHVNHGNRVTGSSEIVVIEDNFHHKDFSSTGFRTNNLPSVGTTRKRSVVPADERRDDEEN
nr:hypothetical protein BaRGS_002015 [Batillaria attramentaria]